MSMRVQALPLLLIAGFALPAAAQPAPAPQAPAPPPAAAPSNDVIGALLDHRGQEPPGDEDEPDTASQPRTAPEPEPTLILPAAPAPPQPRQQLTAPVHVEDTSRTPDAPPTLRDLAYDSRIRASFAAAQGFQGPLDGGWTLAANGAPDAGDLYSLQLVDRADRLEGVWRDPRRKGALDASGLVDDIRRQGQELTLRFTPAAGASATATLHGSADGRWTGELSEGGKTRKVTLRRTGP